MAVVLEQDRIQMQRTVDSLRLELRGRKTEAECAELMREKDILEDLVVSTQGENERCEAELKRWKAYAKELEKKIEAYEGPNWQEGTNVPATPAAIKAYRRPIGSTMITSPTIPATPSLASSEESLDEYAINSVPEPKPTFDYTPLRLLAKSTSRELLDLLATDPSALMKKTKPRSTCSTVKHPITGSSVSFPKRFPLPSWTAVQVYGVKSKVMDHEEQVVPALVNASKREDRRRSLLGGVPARFGTEAVKKDEGVITGAQSAAREFDGVGWIDDAPDDLFKSTQDNAHTIDASLPDLGSMENFNSEPPSAQSTTRPPTSRMPRYARVDHDEEVVPALANASKREERRRSLLGGVSGTLETVMAKKGEGESAWRKNDEAMLAKEDDAKSDPRDNGNPSEESEGLVPFSSTGQPILEDLAAATSSELLDLLASDSSALTKRAKPTCAVRIVNHPITGEMVFFPRWFPLPSWAAAQMPPVRARRRVVNHEEQVVPALVNASKREKRRKSLLSGVPATGAVNQEGESGESEVDEEMLAMLEKSFQTWWDGLTERTEAVKEAQKEIDKAWRKGWELPKGKAEQAASEQVAVPIDPALPDLGSMENLISESPSIESQHVNTGKLDISSIDSILAAEFPDWPYMRHYRQLEYWARRAELEKLEAQRRDDNETGKSGEEQVEDTLRNNEMLASDQAQKPAELPALATPGGHTFERPPRFNEREHRKAMRAAGGQRTTEENLLLAKDESDNEAGDDGAGLSDGSDYLDPLDVARWLEDSDLDEEDDLGSLNVSGYAAPVASARTSDIVANNEKHRLVANLLEDFESQSKRILASLQETLQQAQETTLAEKSKKADLVRAQHQKRAEAVQSISDMADDIRSYVGDMDMQAEEREKRLTEMLETALAHAELYTPQPATEVLAAVTVAEANTATQHHSAPTRLTA